MKFEFEYGFCWHLQEAKRRKVSDSHYEKESEPPARKPKKEKKEKVEKAEKGALAAKDNKKRKEKEDESKKRAR